MAFPTFLRVALITEQFFHINETSVTKEHISASNHFKFVEILSEKLGFSYTLLTSVDDEIGKRLPKGTWTGLIGMLLRNEADLALGMISTTMRRQKVVDFTYPYYLPRMTFATRNPQHTSQLTTFLMPFSYEVWGYMLVCLFIFMCLYFELLKRRYSLQRIIMYLLSTVLQQSLMLNPKTADEYILLSFGLMAFMFLGYCYTAVLLSFLTLPNNTGIRTIPELAAAVEDGAAECYAFPGSFLTYVLRKSVDSHVKAIGENLRQNEGSKDIYEVLRNNEIAEYPTFLAGEDALLPFDKSFFISKDQFLVIMRSIAMQKNFCCKERLNYFVSSVWSSGIYNKLIGDVMFKKSLKYIYSPLDETTNEKRPLYFEDLEGAFILLAVEHVVSLGVFFAELILGKSRIFFNISRAFKKYSKRAF